MKSTQFLGRGFLLIAPFLSISLVELWAPASQAAVPDYCVADSVKPELIAKLSDIPSYFAKITADGKQMGFILDNGNYLTDLTPDRANLHVPGPYDPVPTSDGKWILIPYGGTISFFSRAEFNKHRMPGQLVDLAEANPVFANTGLDGNYQSSGIIGTPNGPNGTVYRVNISGDAYGDYSVTKEGHFNLRGNLHSLCSNVGDALRLPMISKDGTMVAGYLPETNSTIIYRINGNNCEKLLDLGIATGKVEFNYTGDMIAFHADSFAADDVGSFFSGVRVDLTKNVYVAKLDTSNRDSLSIISIQRVTNNTSLGSGSYYPSFTEDNRIAYLHGENGNYSIRVLNPSGQQPAPYVMSSPGHLSLGGLALGALWEKACRSSSQQQPANKGVLMDDALTSLSLDTKACQNLIQEKWATLKPAVVSRLHAGKGQVTLATLNKLKPEDLMDACPKALNGQPAEVHTVTQEVVLQETQPSAPIPGNQVFEARCMGCHDSTNGSAPQFVWNQLDSGTIDEMIRRVQVKASDSDHMPPNVQLNREFEMKTLIQTLNQRKQTAPQ